MEEKNNIRHFNLKALSKKAWPNELEIVGTRAQIQQRLRVNTAWSQTMSTQHSLDQHASNGVYMISL